MVSDLPKVPRERAVEGGKMKHSVRHGVGIIAATVVVASLLSGAASAQTGTPASKVIFTLGDTQDVDSMNPAISQSGGITYLQYDMLVAISTKDFSPTPDLAERWQTSKDGLTWTFFIRHDMKWSDGKPITANDVAFTYERALNDPIGNWKSYLDQIDSIRVVDDYTLAITTKSPTTSLLSALVPILPEHIFKSVDAQELKTYENYPAVTSGPFRVVKWVKGQYFQMDANPDWWGERPR